ncbi:DUF2958 domain-containing protein [Sphingomonas sp. R647]|uniref:DUF2958 domain-containing protein n=1 Tax=unclassified Sphingomonas TaxID=196159 RepID=UPI001CD24CBD|nr:MULTISPECIES: DUF2958 domain-containing protein [unclassified Sphingomonas]MCA1197902.1 DUF2958 domain-containing protein [Sphingomonas sp. R647]MCR5871286.1 DUF2958 domain-containing protein [Sphingomonas sp. J344]UUY00409.1 DUF2958 domain-containing protein [Sphingomonas sp. J315]
MILLTPELRATLRVNAERSAACDHDPAPVVKFFNPLGAATWLATELYDDGDTLFGLADLGFGCPELGHFSLSELAGIGLPFGLGIERDIDFSTTVSLSVWADVARRAGSISQAQSIIWRIESAPVPELPTDPEHGRGG